MKMKIFGWVTGVLAIALVGLWYLYGNLQEDNQTLRVANETYESSLEDASETIQAQKEDMERLQSILARREERNREVERRAEERDEAFELGKDESEKFKQCLDVLLPESYLESLGVEINEE